MGARTGQEYLERLAQTRPTIEINGERVAGPVPAHPALASIVRSYAALYDLQHDPELRDVLTYESPSSRDRVGMSFLVPRNADELSKRRAGFKAWADHSLGTLGRTGDYLNSALMALSEAGPWFAQADRRFADNMAAYYEKVREEDLLTTHTLIPPQANRAAQPGRPGRPGAKAAPRPTTANTRVADRPVGWRPASRSRAAGRPRSTPPREPNRSRPRAWRRSRSRSNSMKK